MKNLFIDIAMNNQKHNFIVSKSHLIKLALCFSVVSISVIMNSNTVALPIYPRYGLFQPYSKPRYPSRNETANNIADVLSKNSKFNNFVDGLKQANLLDTFKEPCPKEQPYCLTIFAPNNEAFNSTPRAVYQKYNQPENRIKVLKYHIVQGAITPQDVDSGSKMTIEGHPIKITETSEGVYKLNDANAKHPSILTSNGVIIEIDQVLIPPGL
jgi:uncharacterized surface protein with fasciclin (FAS1) repeats